MLLINRIKNDLKITAVKVPSFGENSKNLLLNSMTLKRIDIISPLKDSNFKKKGLSRNYELSGLNNSIGLIPMTHRTGKICLLNK